MNDDIDRSPTARARRYDREHARRLRALAYRMLGSRAEAEDMVQEAWLRWAEVDEATVQHPDAFLSRLVTNLCLDRLRSAAAQREQYVGVWLPEPMLEDEALFGWMPGPETQAEFAQDVSVAFMLALERLSPLERAAFLLHDVFDLDYNEIAHHLDRSEAACRQLISRARRNVKADYARREVAQPERDRLTAAFMHAVRSHDVSALTQLLTEDAVLLADGGGKVTAVPQPLHGGAAIASTFIGFAQISGNRGWRLVPARVNGLPGCLIFDDLAGGVLVQTIALAPAAAAPGRVGALYVQRNPDKLRAIARRLQP
ncbi:RNA polymerase sigma factor SigJ [Chitiniphilus purpureus]|uniref:RNA polymerase sigma factor SigJ n=1 Tax=Chitiniphilus purpureus TaxID=2981137 RepID=A0ABY6DPU6_9NEIS|nr:RNA polymerase sigma factor SigJ [Chitiniphilus sp. CD1]UXY15506.1 RNA polymerase sigma factor SigJ [Chitiniphilus sp. CD1]